MSYTEQDVERVKRAMYEAYPAQLVGGDSDRILSYDEWVEYFGDDEVFWQSDMRELDLHARAALEAMEREPLEDGDLLDRLTRVAEAGFHWWEAWADEGDYDGEYKHMDREQRIDHILCHDLLLALDALAPDYFDGLTGKPKYAVAAAKGDE